jgi:hypothetical protein
MALTLGTTGMDSATEAELRSAFQQANAGLGNRWQLVDEAQADYVVVDMDSMYGPMSWLRLHAAGKQVIGLTSAPRTQTDYRLERPIDAAGVSALLGQISGGAPAPQAVSQQAAAPAPTPSGMSPSPVQQDQLPEEMPQKPREDLRPPSPAPKLPDSVQAGTLASTTIEPPHAPVTPPPAPTPAPPPAAPAPPAQRRLSDWLAPGELEGRVRYQRGAGPALLLDGRERIYHGPAALKPLAGYFDGPFYIL